MKILNFGSLNIDRVYRVASIVRPGETISSLSDMCCPGGKGLNQSIALARAGAAVLHAGMIGEDGCFLRQLLEQENVDCSLLKTADGMSTGMAFIQVADSGENSIVLSGGANRNIDSGYISKVFSYMSAGDLLVLQNEISCIDEIIRKASSLNMKIYFNPAPMSPDVAELPLELVDTLILNDTEHETLIFQKRDIPACCNLLLTHGAKGASYHPAHGGKPIFTVAAPVQNVVDTTAAGDTFIGYFIAGLLENNDPQRALKYASHAAAICVSRPGAAPSIPFADEVRKSMA